MDELELLKKDWNKNSGKFKQVSENEIYGMLHKSSSSIVKWIFIISVLEIILWTSLGFLTNNDTYWKMLNKYHLKTFMLVISIINYVVIICFIYKFYTNYKKINAADAINHLLKNILDSRKTVKQYVNYNLLMIGFILIVAFVAQTTYEPKLQEIINRFGENSNKGYVLVFGIYFIFILVFTFIIWLFYRLIYGFFMRRLKQNYNELQKIEY
ncbi:hypothetical protein [Flavobacterium sp.]|jgi:hypothetical protein|uniref:hypothetical protein n=1 Tax=Flavobacterium sp. TaxID=239 RepID=UPI0037BEA581